MSFEEEQQIDRIVERLDQIVELLQAIESRQRKWDGIEREIKIEPSPP
jgi:hypothetical protein